MTLSFRNPKHPFPTYTTVFLVEGEPNQYRFSNDVVLRHETPIARVGGVVAVVAHHPVVVHLEGVTIGGLAIDIDLVALHLQVMEFVGMDDALVERQSVKVKFYCHTLLGDIKRPEVVDIPRIEVGTVGEEAGIGTFTRGLHVAHY